jgi:hypothetical protein
MACIFSTECRTQGKEAARWHGLLCQEPIRDRKCLSHVSPATVVHPCAGQAAPASLITLHQLVLTAQ